MTRRDNADKLAELLDERDRLTSEFADARDDASRVAHELEVLDARIAALWAAVFGRQKAG